MSTYSKGDAVLRDCPLRKSRCRSSSIANATKIVFLSAIDPPRSSRILEACKCHIDPALIRLAKWQRVAFWQPKFRREVPGWSTLFYNRLLMADNTIDLKKLGHKVRFLRQGREWTLADLAEHAKVSKAYLSDLEN